MTKSISTAELFRMFPDQETARTYTGIPPLMAKRLPAVRFAGSATHGALIVFRA